MKIFPERCGYSGYGDPKILTFEGINVRLENVGDVCMDPQQWDPGSHKLPVLQGILDWEW